MTCCFPLAAFETFSLSLSCNIFTAKCLSVDLLCVPCLEFMRFPGCVKFFNGFVEISQRFFEITFFHCGLAARWSSSRAQPPSPLRVSQASNPEAGWPDKPSMEPWTDFAALQPRASPRPVCPFRGLAEHGDHQTRHEGPWSDADGWVTAVEPGAGTGATTAAGICGTRLLGNHILPLHLHGDSVQELASEARPTGHHIPTTSCLGGGGVWVLRGGDLALIFTQGLQGSPRTLCR